MVAHPKFHDAWDNLETNVDGSFEVARAAVGRRLVHMSTDLVFDGTRGRYREDDAVNPILSYGRSKAEAERCVLAAHAHATVARTSLLYGGAEPAAQERLARENTRFYIDELRSPVAVADLAEALLDLLEREWAGPLHMGGADDVSRFDFAVLLGADRRRLEAVPAPCDRPRDTTLDSSRASTLLPTRLRGVREVLT
jgi:dTDP-4-dehydrorhamnose reductase